MENIRIASGGKACVTILTTATPTPQENYAATELRHYLNLMTAARPAFVIAGEAEGPVITIGAASARLGLSYDETRHGEDGFTVKSVDGNIALVGGVRGIIYAVYELLEQLGCRFFTALAEKVPCVPELTAPPLDITQKPVLEYRLHSYKDISQFPRFAVKSRINASRTREEYGGGIGYVPGWFVHTFEKIIHPDEYFDTHPEYFSEVDGKRKREFSQLCLTNPDVLEITVKKVSDTLRAHPESRIISVSPNDWYSFCTCDACRAIDEREETNAGSLIWFVNQVAERIEPEFPKAIVETLAYQYSRQVTKHLEPRHNVCIRLCSIESCFSHPFETCDDQTRKTPRPPNPAGEVIHTSFIEDLQDWAKKSDRLYIWDYTTGFAHYPAPHANWAVLQPNMRSFINNNVKGVFEQPCGAWGGSTDLNELRCYLLCKLMWDADCDVETHKREFCEFYYGAAAEHVLEYIRVLTEKVNRDNIHTGFNEQCDKAYLTDEMLDIYEALFAKAEAAVLGDAIRLMRVKKAQLSFRWVRMKNAQMRGEAIDPAQVGQFFEDWRAHGLTRIDEWVSAETTLRAFLDGKWRGTDYYHHWTDEGPERL
ncbi:MAG: DUF4838 domain-containing protein [Defluviitaleaceae bacterium]|nr:DUF4838 domain-containing protein [Defluviitaleaceae bacterium]